jgi:hypothetical protein
MTLRLRETDLPFARVTGDGGLAGRLDLIGFALEIHCGGHCDHCD